MPVEIAAMDVKIAGSQGIPEGSIVSVRFGNKRRHGLLGQEVPLRFSDLCGRQGMKVDVYAPLARARLVVEPGAAKWSVDLDAVATSASGSPPANGLCVNFETSLPGVGQPVPTSPVDESPLKKMGLSSAYFEKHDLTNVLQALLQAVIREEPECPYSYMIRMLQNSVRAADGRPSTSPTLSRDLGPLMGSGGGATGLAQGPPAAALRRQARAGKNVLCTGGSGYVGSHTVLQLAKSGFQVSILDCLLSANSKVLGGLKELTGQDIPFFQLDMCDEEAMDKLFAEKKFDAVMHFAGLNSSEESLSEPMRYYENNVGGTTSLLRAMAKNDCKTLVFSSAASVYEPSDAPIDESTPRGSATPEGWTKIMIEQIIQDTAQASGFAVSLLRCFNPCGAHASGKLGESPDEPPTLVTCLQQVASGRRERLSIFGGDFRTPDGTAVRDYVHVEDLAEGHVCALKKTLETGSGVTVHNLGSGRGVSVLEMVRALESASGKTLPYDIVARRSTDLPTVVANPTKAKADLSWEAKRGLSDIMASVCKVPAAVPAEAAPPVTQTQDSAAPRPSSALNRNDSLVLAPPAPNESPACTEVVEQEAAQLSNNNETLRKGVEDLEVKMDQMQASNKAIREAIEQGNVEVLRAAIG